MRRFLTSLTLTALAAVTLPALSAPGLTAQEVVLPEVVSKMVAFGPDEARLTLELSDGRDVELALTDGEVRMGDEVLGRYREGGALEASWRELVAQAVTLENEALLQSLVDWSPPEGLDADGQDVAQRMDEFLALNFDSASIRSLALEASLEAQALQESLSQGLQGLEGLALLSRLEVLASYAEAVESMDMDNLRIVIDDHLEIGAGVDFPGSILVIDGSLEVRGTVEGDVMVIDGDVELGPGSEIQGSVRLADASVDNDGGRIVGRVVELDRSRSRMEMELRDEILQEIRNEVGVDFEDRGRSWGGPVGDVFGAIGDVFGRLFKILILGLVGAALFHFAEPNMDAIAQTARDSTGRAALVGMAGGALALPVFVLGIVGLAVTIVGIPAILLWVPLFPAAVIFACIVGYLAVARNLGAWLSRQRYPYLDWVRITNPVTLVFGGLLVLAAPFLAGDLVDVVPFLGVFGFLLGITGFFASLFAGAVGLGAVLLTRGGRKPEEWGSEMFTSSWRPGNWSWGRRERDEEAEAFDEELRHSADDESDGQHQDPGAGPDDHEDDHDHERA